MIQIHVYFTLVYVLCARHYSDSLADWNTQVFLHALQGSKQDKGISKVTFNAVCYAINKNSIILINKAVIKQRSSHKLSNSATGIMGKLSFFMNSRLEVVDTF